MRQGIAVGGTILVDKLKVITAFPKRHELVKIQSMTMSPGGAVSNVLGDLARLDDKLPLYAVGRVGQDDEGRYLLDTLRQYPNVDLSGMIVEEKTSFTDVLIEADSRARTFLVFPGANTHLDVPDFDFDRMNCRLLHMAYILLLEKLDSPDEEYGTRMARLLHNAQQKGIRTSIDVVSEVGERYKTLVPPALKYTDYLVINEIEAGKTCGIDLRDEAGKLIRSAIPQALRALRAMGVGKWVVIHAPEGGWGLDEADRLVYRPSLLLPDGFIRGTVGAGDAFCAGVLLAAYRGEPLETAIDDGAAAAACSLRESGSSEGVESLEKARALARKLGWRAE